jgi:hypothetical protein
MKGSYVEDLANHDGPESCVGDPRGRSEALTGVHAGWLLSLEMEDVQGADALAMAEGNTAGGVMRAVSGPCGVGEPVHACDLFMLRTGRSHGHPSVVMVGRVVRGRPRP